MNRGYAFVGVVAAVAGLAVVSVPSLGRGFDAGFALVAVAGVAAVVQGLFVAVERYDADRTRADPPVVEDLSDLARPGDSFDDQVARVDTAAEAGHRAAITERLEAAALNVLAREGRSREAARALLETGEWTDDPHAAAFFAAEGDASFESWVRSAVSEETAFRREACHAARAIAERAEGDRV